MPKSFTLQRLYKDTDKDIEMECAIICQSRPPEGARFSFNANVTRPKWINWSNQILVIDDVVHIRAELRLMHAVVLSCWTLRALGIKSPAEDVTFVRTE